VTEVDHGERRAARYLKRFAPPALVLIALSAATLSPYVRTQLRESFTRLPSEYTELYFSTDPALTGTGASSSVRVPVSLVHHGAAAKSFIVRATITANTGGAAATGETILSGVPGEVASAVLVVRVPRRAAAYVVGVTLPGYAQALHFRLDPKDASDFPDRPEARTGHHQLG
jgi:hypothetical protein